MLSGARRGRPKEPEESGIPLCDGGEGPQDARPKPSAAATDAVLAIWAERGIRNRYVIAGNSMLPLIRDGDAVLVEHGTRGIGTGTLILFRSGPSLTAHRVLRCVQDSQDVTYYVKGDNTPHVDRVSQAAVIGRVLGIERGGYHLWLNTSLWRAAGRLTAAVAPWQRPGNRAHPPGGWRPAAVAWEWIAGWLWRLRLRLSAMILKLALLASEHWRGGDLPE